ncbi:MAG TPA: hypothetical protein VI386_09475, partial [Candidatus Sulfotelmatobacter sp.]
LCWLALSGGACLLERIGHEPVVIQRLSQPAERDISDVLRPETDGTTEYSGTGDKSDSLAIRAQQ